MLILYRYTELLKVIEMTYHRHAMAIAPYFNAIMQYQSQRLLKIITIAKVERCFLAFYFNVLVKLCFRNELHQQQINDLRINKLMFLQHLF